MVQILFVGVESVCRPGIVYHVIRWKNIISFIAEVHPMNDSLLFQTMLFLHCLCDNFFLLFFSVVPSLRVTSGVNIWMQYNQIMVEVKLSSFYKKNFSKWQPKNPAEIYYLKDLISQLLFYDIDHSLYVCKAVTNSFRSDSLQRILVQKYMS